MQINPPLMEATPPLPAEKTLASPCVGSMRLLLSPDHCPRSPFMLGGAQSTTSFGHESGLSAPKIGGTCSPTDGKKRGPLNGFLLCNMETCQQDLFQRLIYKWDLIASSQVKESRPQIHVKKGHRHLKLHLQEDKSYRNSFSPANSCVPQLSARNMWRGGIFPFPR